MRICLLALAIACAAVAQTQEERTFRFRSAVTEQDYKDLSVAALMMSNLKATGTETSLNELKTSGPLDQLRIAEWVIAELDRPVPPTPPPASSIYTLQTKEPEDSIRVFYPQVPSDQAFNEVMTAIRTISDIRYASPYLSHRATVLRGTREQLDLAEWLLAEMHRDAPQDTYVFPKIDTPQTRGENQVRVFRFTRAKDVQAFNEVQTMIRTLSDTRRVYPYLSRRAIIMRGTEEQIDMSRWILAQLDKELPVAQRSVSTDYTNKAGEVTRMFHFAAAMPENEFKDTSTAIRMATGIRRVYSLLSARTLAMRGTAVQIAQAAALAGQ